MVVPMILYGFVVWGVRKYDILEKLHLRFHKYIFRVKSNTSNCMLYGELGGYPVGILSNVQ